MVSISSAVPGTSCRATIAPSLRDKTFAYRGPRIKRDRNAHTIRFKGSEPVFAVPRPLQGQFRSVGLPRVNPGLSFPEPSGPKITIFPGHSTICKITCCPDLEAAAFNKFRTAVMVCPLRPITLPTSDLRISTLKINFRPCSTLVTKTSSGASTSCLMTNSRKVSTGNSLSRRRFGRHGRGGFLASFQDHARHGRAGLGAICHPIVHPPEIQMKIFPGFTRIVVTDHLDKLSIPRTAFVRHHDPIVRTVFRSFSP
jgi:hypothetical protein